MVKIQRVTTSISNQEILNTSAAPCSHRLVCFWKVKTDWLNHIDRRVIGRYAF